MERQEGLPATGPVTRASTGDLVMIAIIAIAGGLSYYYLQFDNVLKVVVGLSLVIFIHELGHFLVAKACDVHVTHFSIGFGPVIPGCWFKWGETMYQICLLPLGGYVQMIGQVDGDESSDGSESDPRSYRNKSIGQRMAIISAGVIMNVLLALVCFIAIYRGPGKDRLAAVVAAVDGGGPAFVDGLHSGMEITQIGNVKDPYYDDLKVVVMSSTEGEKIKLVAKGLGDDSSLLDITIEPRKNKKDSNPVIGVQPASIPKFGSRKDVVPSASSPAEPTTPASLANPAFEFDDAIVGTTDPLDPNTIKPLPDDPRKPAQKDYFEFIRRMQLLAHKPVVLRVRRASGDVDITVQPAYRTTLGASMEMGQIVAVRKNSPADLAKIQLPETGQKFVKGDVIEKVEVTDADGKRLVFEKASLDPERLPSILKSWAQRLTAANKMKTAPVVTLFVQRHRQGGGPQLEVVKLELPWENERTFDNVSPLSLASPLAIPELGFAYQVRAIVANVNDPQSALKPGDVIKNIRLTLRDANGKETNTGWRLRKKEINSEEWAFIGRSQFESGAKIEKVELKVERDKKIEEIEVAAAFDDTWPLVYRGWLLRYDMRKQQADTTLEAISLGVQDTHKSMYNILRGIWQMITGRIDWDEHLGGPITIARIAYGIAGQDLWEFIFFLGMISVNLAVINFLPIPLLDGGHMVFLIYEKLRGKPASEGVRIAATYVGLAFIACLMLLVTWLDIGRFL